MFLIPSELRSYTYHVTYYIIIDYSYQIRTIPISLISRSKTSPKHVLSLKLTFTRFTGNIVDENTLAVCGSI